MTKYNHAYDFAFEVISHDEDASDVTPEMIRDALLTRVLGLPMDEFRHACSRFDTMEEAYDGLDIL